MIHKILSKLFSWDYIYWQNNADQGIARVYKTPDNTVYFYRYKSIGLMDKITNQKQVIWLTCKPEKYIT